VAHSLGGDIAGNGALQGSHNLVQDGSGLPGWFRGDPGLDPVLKDNGGPTWTHALLPGSVAIDAGDNSLVAPGASTDQRGWGRFANGVTDLGAFEFWSADLAGNVIFDTSQDGSADPGERGVGGLVVFADINNNGILDDGNLSAVTDAQGHYVLSGLADGVTYTVRLLARSDFAPTGPTSGEATATTGGEGPTFTGVSFLNLAPPTDPTNSTEPTLPTDDNPVVLPVPLAKSSVNSPTVAVLALAQGSVNSVVVDSLLAQQNTVATAQLPSLPGAVAVCDLAFLPEYLARADAQLTPTDPGGTEEVALADVHGTLFTDCDSDGVCSADEPLLSGRVVRLVDETDSVVAVTTTGPDGVYHCAGVPAGRYRVEADPGLDWQGAVSLSFTVGTEPVTVDPLGLPLAAEVTEQAALPVSVGASSDQGPATPETADAVWLLLGMALPMFLDRNDRRSWANTAGPQAA
jgi:hypothetical protein